MICFAFVSGVNRAKIDEVTLNALRTRQSLVKGERLVRHEVRAVLPSSVSGPIGRRLPVCIAGSSESLVAAQGFAVADE